MLQRLLAKRRDQTVMGHRLKEPRLTLMALLWGLLYVGLPIIGFGLLMDVLIALAMGHCFGLWCYF
jgi:hypothetical protein